MLFRTRFAFSACLVLLLTLLILSACGGEPVPALPNPEIQDRVAEIEPLALADAQPPVLLSIPEIDLETAVIPMGWRVVAENGERTTAWDVPYSSAGWHVTSAGVGAAGNVIISGHQVVGEAVFAPLALGEAEVGQTIYLTDSLDRIFVYEIIEVAEPIPLVGASEEDIAAAQAYLVSTDAAELTLMTGWPDFSTTHYLFVRANLIGQSKIE